jgi:biopolymer transport protein ExbB
MIPDWFYHGGVVMYPLALCSVAGVAFVLERIWALQRRQVMPPPLTELINGQLSEPATREQLKQRAANDRSVLAELIRTVLGHASLAKHENIEAVQAVARQMVGRLERGLTTLALIVELGPLLGLLGAVSGMVHVFGEVALHGLRDPALISKGISEALIATFAGLAVAILALVPHMYLRRRVENLTLELERHVNELITHLYR